MEYIFLISITKLQFFIISTELNRLCNQFKVCPDVIEFTNEECPGEIDFTDDMKIKIKINPYTIPPRNGVFSKYYYTNYPLYLSSLIKHEFAHIFTIYNIKDLKNKHFYGYVSGYAKKNKLEAIAETFTAIVGGFQCNNYDCYTLKQVLNPYRYNNNHQQQGNYHGTINW